MTQPNHDFWCVTEEELLWLLEKKHPALFAMLEKIFKQDLRL